jgi:outer membrane protein assembly factor BamD
MFWNKISLRLFIFSLLVLFISSCSQYEKLLKSDDFQLKYDVAMEYYEKGDYVRSATLIEQILPVYKGTQRAAELSFTLANSYYHRGDYIMAAHYFDNFVREYPNSQHVEEATYMRAYCNYLLSPRPSLDQSTTNRAIDQFRLFMTRYPGSDKVDEAQRLINEMRAKLLEKSFQSARLYFDMDDYRAAIIALKNSLVDYPETRHREEIMFLILKASFLLADNSVPDRQLERFQSTIDEYYAFIEEFPESQYTNEAKQFFNTSLRVLDNYPTDELNELTLDY